jgi:hypothetical protein
LIGCHDISPEIQENVTIHIYIDNGHLVNPVFNINVKRVKKRGRKQGDKRKKDDKEKKDEGKKDDDGGRDKRRKVIIMGA